MIHEAGAYAFCCEDITKIENYEQAVSDKSESWQCHHRAEVLPCGNFSANVLKRFGLYWHRPASELIFLTRSQHCTLHRKNQAPEEKMKRKSRVITKETRERLSKAAMGRSFSEETRKKLSAAKQGSRHPNFGKHLSESTRRKISEANAGKANTLGHHHSEESKKKMSEAKRGNTNVRGTFWWNNGIVNTRAKECPGKEWHKGRLSNKMNK